MFDDDADLKDVVLDDRTARTYGLDIEDRALFGGQEFTISDTKPDYVSPILDDGDDEFIGGSSVSSKPGSSSKIDDANETETETDDDFEDEIDDDLED